MARVVKMTVTDVRERAGTAREHLQVALERLEMCVANPDRSSEAQVAVSAAIAAADALCGHALRERGPTRTIRRRQPCSAGSSLTDRGSRPGCGGS
ncbi:hypothetical protein [Cellulomonas oligotrophica]|uniref:Uncharacterized protein n=1 Tax=Cellulomonas oligotrophica TaxID=931536 RepID=A0A7Y9FGK1_9CELL|nr:hypothetical protein [Cellulomonas oligotrophica]NYD86948.1 hypothetical protein [Cellulomonas oligotrophica]